MTSLFGGSPRASTPNPPATSLRVQTSVQGTPIPVGWGTGRLAGNLIYYADFRSIQVQQAQQGGGKGTGGGGSGKQGGGQEQTVYYTTVMMGLCEGPIVGVGTVWNSKNITSLGALNFSLFTGSYAQTAWGYVVSAHPGDARANRGIAYIAAAPFNLGASPDLPALNIEVKFGFFAPGAPQDANAKDIIVDSATNDKYGIGFPLDRFGDGDLYGVPDIYALTDWYGVVLTPLYAYGQAAGIWMSPVLTQQKAYSAFLSDILYGLVAEAVWSGGKLKVVPYYDSTISGNGYTYVPNLSPLFDLADDDFLPSGNSYESPVVVRLKQTADTYNKVTVKYPGRANAYNPTVAEAKDDASIQDIGLRSRDPKQVDVFALDSSATTCSHLQLGREQVKATFEFTLVHKYVLLEPMDLVTVTDPAMRLSRKLVRIKEITENPDDASFSMIAEDMLVGSASPPLYGVQVNTGFVPDYNADPGVTNTPFFFEPSDPLTGPGSKGLEVWAGITGVNPAAWGGANVYVSYDGVNYDFVGQQLGPTSMGVLTGALAAVPASTLPPTIDPASVLAVDLALSQAQLLSGTTADLLGFATLCYVGGEFLAYQNATPTGANAYNLTNLNRGGYGTAPKSSPAGTTFVRINKGVFRVPFTADRIGQTLYVKLVNFNHAGAGPQTLASVSAYTYTIQGTALTSPLPDVQNFTTNYQSNITLFSWDEVDDFRNPIDYEIRRGSDWNTAQVIGRYLHPNVPAIGSSLGGTVYLIKAHAVPVPGLDVYSMNAAQIGVISNTAVIPLNIVKSWDEFFGATGVLTGTFAGDVYNNSGTIETFETGDLYGVADIYALTDWYNFGNGGSGDVYDMTDVYGIVDVYNFATVFTVSGTYTIPASHIVNVGRIVGCLVDCSWTTQGVPVGQNIFTWTDVFSFNDIFAASANMFITTFPNINLSADGVVFLGWQRYRAGFYSAMAFNMQLFLESFDLNTIDSASSFTFAVHIPSRIDHYIGLTLAAAGTTITFKPDGSATLAAFNGGSGGVPATPGLPVYQAVIVDEAAGDVLAVTSLTLSSAFVRVTNASVGVIRTINIEFAGY